MNIVEVPAHEVRRGDTLVTENGTETVGRCEIWWGTARICYGAFGILSVPCRDLVRIVRPEVERDFETEWRERNEVIEFDVRTWEELGLDADEVVGREYDR